MCRSYDNIKKCLKKRMFRLFKKSKRFVFSFLVIGWKLCHLDCCLDIPPDTWLYFFSFCPVFVFVLTGDVTRTSVIVTQSDHIGLWINQLHWKFNQHWMATCKHLNNLQVVSPGCIYQCYCHIKALPAVVFRSYIRLFIVAHIVSYY